MSTLNLFKEALKRITIKIRGTENAGDSFLKTIHLQSRRCKDNIAFWFLQIAIRSALLIKRRAWSRSIGTADVIN
jgi:hypothetical protein